MLPSTTYEEACCQPRDWVRQRTRWLKGWLQTWLVHMRRPVSLFKVAGSAGVCGVPDHIGGAGPVAGGPSSFYRFHDSMRPGAGICLRDHMGCLALLFWGLALGNFILGYGVAIWLGFATLRKRRFLSPHTSSSC